MKRWQRTVTLLLFLAALLAACGPHPPAPTADRTVGAPPPPAHYTVRRGDTLYSIAWQYGLDHRQVAVWNGIGAPYTIYPGQRLALRKAAAPATRQPPVTASRAQTAQPVPAPTKPAPAPAQPAPVPAPRVPASGSAAPPVPAPAPATRPASRPDPAAPTSVRTVGGVAWRWPTRGRLYRTFSEEDPSRKGVDIVGSEGQPVFAASAGKVVYSGNGLVGYGNLVIIKHNDTYLSAYGHNRELLVGEGDDVVAGQLIAKMGRVDNDRAMLHFEIRREGRPVDPLRLLPKG